MYYKLLKVLYREDSTPYKNPQQRHSTDADRQTQDRQTCELRTG